MKKILLIIGIVVIVVLSIFVYFSMSFSDFKNKLMATKIELVDLSLVKDGTYDGNYDLKFVTASVTVTVLDHKIINIELKEHKHGPDAKYGADDITRRVVEKQSLEVDSVSGASGSSRVVKKAIEIALKKGL